MPSHAHLAKIHIAKKEMALDDQAYRDILRRLFKVESSAGLTDRKANLLLRELQRLGWQPGHRSKQRKENPQGRMIQAMWVTMGKAGCVRKATPRALDAYVKRMTGLDALRFCDSAFKSRLIEDLKAWQARDLRKVLGGLLLWWDMEPVIGDKKIMNWVV